MGRFTEARLKRAWLGEEMSLQPDGTRQLPRSCLLLAAGALAPGQPLRAVCAAGQHGSFSGETGREAQEPMCPPPSLSATVEMALLQGQEGAWGLAGGGERRGGAGEQSSPCPSPLSLGLGTVPLLGLVSGV